MTGPNPTSTGTHQLPSGSQLTLIIGESMLELTQHTADLLKQSFAGDTHSVAVYMKRLNPSSKNHVQLLSAIGRDTLSQQLKAGLDQEGVDTSALLEHPTRTIGLYMVHTDQAGERSFQYWRSQSAAKHMLTLLNERAELKNTLTPSTVFFSGITLGILDQESRFALRDWLVELREKGTKITFDPNYRPALWESTQATKQNYTWAFEISDLVLPGMDDLSRLYNVANIEQACRLLDTLCGAEAIIKDGENGVSYYADSTLLQFPVQPVANPVDTTAAGDSFNAGFLVARGQGRSMTESIQFAAQVAAIVIQHKGAIIPKSALSGLLNQ